MVPRASDSYMQVHTLPKGVPEVAVINGILIHTKQGEKTYASQPDCGLASFLGGLFPVAEGKKWKLRLFSVLFV